MPGVRGRSVHIIYAYVAQGGAKVLNAMPPHTDAVQGVSAEDNSKRGSHLELVGRFPLNGCIESLSAVHLAPDGRASLLVCCKEAKVCTVCNTHICVYGFNYTYMCVYVYAYRSIFIIVCVCTLHA